MLADRLILSMFVPRFLASLFAAFAVHSAIEVVDLVNVTGGSSLLWYFFKIPHGLVLVSPIAMLVGGCWTCVYLVRTGQLTALAAAGRGAGRSVLPLIVAGVVWAGCVFVMVTTVAPLGLAAWSDGVGGNESSGWPRWVRGRDGVLIRLSGQAISEIYRDVVVLTLDEDGQLIERVDAERLERDGGGWVLRRAAVFRTGQPPERVDRLELAVQVPSMTTVAPPAHLTWSQLLRATDEASESGADRAPYDAERGLRLALVVASPVCVLLGIVAGVLFGRNLGTAVAATALAGLLYWAILAPIWASAMVGEISAWAVALVPGAVLTVCGGLLWFWRQGPLLR